MLRNVNQVCGVLALIGVGCLAAFGSAGDRIVSAAPGQIGQAGDTGQAIAIGGCNRCAWQHLAVIQPEVMTGTEVMVLPPGTNGVLHSIGFNGGSYLLSDGPVADGKIIVNGLDVTFMHRPLAGENGVAFTNGLAVMAQQNIGEARISVFYRLD